MRLRWVACGVLLSTILPPGTGIAAKTVRPIPAVLHVHSTWSTGDETLDELAARARGRGVQAVFLTENYLLRFEYGLPVLRNLLRYRVEFPSLSSTRLDAYLAAIHSINGRQQDVLFIPGAEVTPHYYWTGSVLDGSLTNRDAQRNLHALGLYQSADYREIPMGMNQEGAPWGAGSLLLLSPVLLVIVGGRLLRLRRRRERFLQYVRVVEDRPWRTPGILCMGLGLLFLINNYPFRTPPVSIYDSTAGLRPHQAFIDYVNTRGGVAVWKLPDARDYHEVEVLGLKATVETRPYPEALLQTDNFTAMGGVYEDNVRFTRPGAAWDDLLGDFLAGKRTSPAWVVAESAYHGEGDAGKHLGDLQTILLASAREPQALLRTIRDGRMYALWRTAETGLVLKDFRVASRTGTTAEMGEQLEVCAGTSVEITAQFETEKGMIVPVEVELIRSGRLVSTFRGETPLEIRWEEAPKGPEPFAFYRLLVRGPVPHQLTSNPIFVHWGRRACSKI